MQHAGKTFVNLADLVNPETGKTYRQENSERTHKFEIGSKVRLGPNPNSEYAERSETDGLVLFVVEQTRDCDQTPLYSLSWMTPRHLQAERDYVKSKEDEGWTIATPDGKPTYKLRLFAFQKTLSGIAEEYLTLVEGPVEPGKYDEE